ncbi:MULTISPECIES: DUF922 domain-containing Zn-dependent protease [unclassified Mesorhizobium]|uniref:DUF922 domain-containing Zn-dependent protease n=1 Tax=unclassified Mesorhizobium TaxID=325217 RepID=UPI000A548924|nr:DUF922 domain-containing protein [Mesorhizobium sp. Root1471]
MIRLGTLIAAIVFPFHGAWAETVEKVATYAVSGATGIELYRSIGERGPKLGPTRAIAHTTFDLKWTRRYDGSGGACRLAVQRPHLVITYTVPKAENLPASVQDRWKTFADGVLRHEKVHGQTIKDMVAEIERFSLEMRVADDPKCSKFRQQLTERLSAISQAQRKQGRDFDRDEFAEGGNMQRLILGLVNGG